MEWFCCEGGVARHPKLGELAAALKLKRFEALGHLVAMWGGVAEHAELGDLAKVSDEQIAMWACWPRDPGDFVRALLAAGLLDPDRAVHGWKKRHEYHVKERNRKRDIARAAREKKAAALDALRAAERADGAPERAPTVPDLTVPEEQHPEAEDEPIARVPRPDDPSEKLPEELVARWNRLAAELRLPQVSKLTPDRRRLAKKRIAEGLLEQWDAFEAGLRASAWHRGENAHQWRADFDWIIAPKSKWIGIIEHGVAARGAHEAAPARPAMAPDGGLSLGAAERRQTFRQAVSDLWDRPWIEPEDERKAIASFAHLDGYAFRDACIAWSQERGAAKKWIPAAQRQEAAA